MHADRPSRLSPVLAVLAAAALAAAGCASAGGGRRGPDFAGEERSAPAFERIRGLAGKWSGEISMGEEKHPAEVEYRVTAAGSAVEEVLFRGTPNEMVTMYYRDGPRLLLTHYCAAGNQPTMVLAPGDDGNLLHFDFVRATNFRSPADGHMHEADFDLSVPDRVRATWTYYEAGKAGHAATIEMRRVK